MTKLLVIGIIVLFVGLAFIPSFNAVSVQMCNNNEMIQIKVEMCKIGGNKEYTLWLTQEESEKLDVLIDDFKVKLGNSEGLEDTKEIHCDMIISLCELGILPDDFDITNRNTILQDVYSLGAIIPLIHSFMDIINYRYLFPDMMNGNSNYFCYLSGEMSKTIYRLFCIGFGIHFYDIIHGDIYDFPANGWLYTDGWLGNVSRDGSFYGGLGPNMYVGHRTYGRAYGPTNLFRGVVGFSGTKIEKGTEHYFYQGFAYVVKFK
jgi:hypothetical protein